MALDVIKRSITKVDQSNDPRKQKTFYIYILFYGYDYSFDLTLFMMA